MAKTTSTPESRGTKTAPKSSSSTKDATTQVGGRGKQREKKD